MAHVLIFLLQLARCVFLGWCDCCCCCTRDRAVVWIWTGVYERWIQGLSIFTYLASIWINFLNYIRYKADSVSEVLRKTKSKKIYGLLWTGRPGVLRFMGSQRVGHDWPTELNWIWVKNTETLSSPMIYLPFCFSSAQWSSVLWPFFIFMHPQTLWGQSLQPELIGIWLCLQHWFDPLQCSCRKWNSHLFSCVILCVISFHFIWVKHL